jgi:hypothetical protein
MAEVLLYHSSKESSEQAFTCCLGSSSNRHRTRRQAGTTTEAIWIGPVSLLDEVTLRVRRTHLHSPLKGVFSFALQQLPFTSNRGRKKPLYARQSRVCIAARRLQHRLHRISKQMIALRSTQLAHVSRRTGTRLLCRMGHSRCM